MFAEVARVLFPIEFSLIRFFILSAGAWIRSVAIRAMHCRQIILAMLSVELSMVSSSSRAYQ